LFDLRLSPVSNGSVEPPRPDVITTEARPVPGRRAWAVAVAVLAIALAAAIIAAVHYHGEAAAERHRARPATVAAPLSPGPLRLSARTVALPSSGTVTGQVTVLSVRPADRPVQVVFSGQISGGIPHQRYALVGNDCTGNAPDHPWAAGIADARGSASLTGPAWTISPRDEYWLWLIPSPRQLPPGLHGSFTPDGRLTAFRSGSAPCTPA
jgi:hypothetical protein